MKNKCFLFVSYVFILSTFFQAEAYARATNGNIIVVQADEKCPCKCGENPCRCPHCPKK